MVSIDLIYGGELRCSAAHGPSGQQLTTDAPTDNQGRGEAFSPTDLLATALGSCMLTIMGITARRHDWDIEGTRAEVIKHMSTDLPRRVSRLVVTVKLADGLDERARTVLRRAALGCPVIHSISSDIQVEHRFD